MRKIATLAALTLCVAAGGASAASADVSLGPLPLGPDATTAPPAPGTLDFANTLVRRAVAVVGAAARGGLQHAARRRRAGAVGRLVEAVGANRAGGFPISAAAKPPGTPPSGARAPAASR